MLTKPFIFLDASSCPQHNIIISTTDVFTIYLNIEDNQCKLRVNIYNCTDQPGNGFQRSIMDTKNDFGSAEYYYSRNINLKVETTVCDCANPTKRYNLPNVQPTG